MSWQNLLVVFMGSALGGVIRYLSSFIFSNDSINYSTVVVNILGCLCIGFCSALSQKFHWNPTLSLFVIIGLLGGFTTFSSFGLDILKLIQGDQVNLALWYIFLSVVGGLAAVFVGWKVAS